jgi:hypothetical protein
MFGMFNFHWMIHKSWHTDRFATLGDFPSYLAIFSGLWGIRGLLGEF